MVGDLQAHAHVLLDQQHRHAFVAHSRDDAEHLATISGARPCDGSSRIRSRGLSSSARAIASISCSPPESWRPRFCRRSARRGKQLEDALDGPGPGPLERHSQIFLDRQIGEDAPSFGHIADAERRDAEGRPARRVLAEDRRPVPARAGVSPMRLRSVVVLPAPLRPSSVVIVPSATSRPTPCRMWLLP